MELGAVVSWKEEMTFDVEIEGHHMTIDAHEEHGGRNLGPAPKPLLLAALAGCASMDVVAILGKMRVPFESLVVDALGQTVEEHPMSVESITLRYRIVGEDLPLNKVQRAINLSEERYCGVWATLSPTVKLESTLEVNGHDVPRER